MARTAAVILAHAHKPSTARLAARQSAGAGAGLETLRPFFPIGGALGFSTAGAASALSDADGFTLGPPGFASQPASNTNPASASPSFDFIDLSRD
jgi:hypothetical protein